MWISTILPSKAGQFLSPDVLAGQAVTKITSNPKQLKKRAMCSLVKIR
jgi:hypothetical protein